MVADDAGGVSGGKRCEIRVVAICLELLRSSEGGLQQAAVAHSRQSPVERQQTPVDGQSVVLVNPCWRAWWAPQLAPVAQSPAPRRSSVLPHLASTCSVLR